MFTDKFNIKVFNLSVKTLKAYSQPLIYNSIIYLILNLMVITNQRNIFSANMGGYTKVIVSLLYTQGKKGSEH